MQNENPASRSLLENNQLLAALELPALIVDTDGIIRQLNGMMQTLCAATGRPIFCGAPVSQVLPSIEAFWPQGKQSFDTGMGVECLPLDTYMRVRGAPLCDSEGELAGWLILMDAEDGGDGRTVPRLRSLLASMDDLVIVINPDGMVVEFHQPASDGVASGSDWMLGRHYREVFPENTSRKFTEMMEIVSETGTTQRYDHLVMVDGEERWYSANMGLLRNDDKTASGFVIVARNITERKLIETAEREQRVLAEALQDVALALNSTLNLDEIWERILSNVVRVVPADAAAILLVENGIARVVGERGYSGRGMDDWEVGHEIMVSRVSRLQHMTETRQPFLAADSRTQRGWSRRAEGNATTLDPNLGWARSYLGAPIVLDKEVIGFIMLESAVANYFTPRDADRLRAFGSHAASAIRNARMFAQAQALAAVEERQRLARDLHDAVSQMLFSAKIIAEMLPRLQERDPDSVWTYLPELQRLIQGAMGEMRMLLLELRPTILTDVDLGVLLRYLVDATGARTSARVMLDATDVCPIPKDVQIGFYRIAQEAMSNAIKHAHASRIDVTIRCTDSRVVLRIEDDGDGFNMEDVRPENLGLTIMQERADEIGARVRLQSALNSGTSVEVVWTEDVELAHKHEEGDDALGDAIEATGRHA
jgi:PAS domain S-box-containing protein